MLSKDNGDKTMIERYSRKLMRDIWTDESKFQAFLDVEIANCAAHFKQGHIADWELKLIKEKASFQLSRINEIEKETRHDVIAFTRTVSESLGPEGRHIHYGLTSTDVVDTANGLLLKKANKILSEDLTVFLDVLKKKAREHKETFIIGRTHGMHADITVFGLKWALWYDEMKRNVTRFNNACKNVEVGKISGAVGNYAFVDPEIETLILDELQLGKTNISTQTLQRDRHAEYIFTLALIASTLEKIATEIRHLQRTEVGEVRERFLSMQKGSSAMPHKRNPISSENICGLARIMRGYVIPVLESNALWHERDISHSSVERIVLPDATILLDYMLTRYKDVLDQLEVFPERMKENINMTKGTIFSQRALTALVDKGLSREEAYDLVQSLTIKAFNENRQFKELLENDSIIKTKLTAAEISELFNLDFYKRNVDSVYFKVFGKQ
jgi:adenylosuccinate lyase